MMKNSTDVLALADNLQVLLNQRDELNRQIETATVDYLERVVQTITPSDDKIDSVVMSFREDRSLCSFQAFDEANDEVLVFVDQHQMKAFVDGHSHYLQALWDGHSESVIVEFNPRQVQNVYFIN